MGTLEHFRTRLGLSPRETFEATVPEAARLQGRRLGQTTEMLLQALAHLADTGEPVTIVAVNRTCSEQMVKLAQGYARKLGLDPSKIQTSHTYAFRASIGLASSPKRFVDHKAAP